MTLNDVMALILCYFTKFNSVSGRLCHSGWRQTYNICDKSAAQRI